MIAYEALMLTSALLLRRLLLAIGLCAAVSTAAAQAAITPATLRPTFRIGFIRQDPETLTTSGVFQRLREFLLAQREIRSAMANAAVEDLLLQSFDSHRLLIEAMDGEQVDMAFCSVLDYAYQRGNYEPVFQLRRPGDPHRSTGGRRVWHTGVLFVNNRSPLFKMDTTQALAALPAYVMEQEMAMVGSSSAAGYVYPYLALDRLSTSVPVMNARSIFWDSSSEVVKAVVNGIHEIGACDSTAIDEVLKAHGLLDKKPQLVKELLRTDPVPRDPILMHARWLGEIPEAGVAATQLGREINRAVAEFFRKEPGLPRLERTSRLPFSEVSENLERFQQLRQEESGGLPQPLLP